MRSVLHDLRRPFAKRSRKTRLQCIKPRRIGINRTPVAPPPIILCNLLCLGRSSGFAPLKDRPRFRSGARFPAARVNQDRFGKIDARPLPSRLKQVLSSSRSEAEEKGMVALGRHGGTARIMIACRSGWQSHSVRAKGWGSSGAEQREASDGDGAALRGPVRSSGFTRSVGTTKPASCPAPPEIRDYPRKRAHLQIRRPPARWDYRRAR